ncbi:MAG: DUF2914 domain-containing protein [Nitrospiria bacterium]
MWKRTLISSGYISALLIGLGTSLCYGGEPASQEVKVIEGFISSDSRHMVSSGQSTPVFYNDDPKIYAVTKISRGPEDTKIKHLWFLRDQIILDTTLTLKENQMRAASGLMMKPNWVGKWRVDVTSIDGTLLYSIPFIVKRKPENFQANGGNSNLPDNLEGNSLPISPPPMVTKP